MTTAASPDTGILPIIEPSDVSFYNKPVVHREALLDESLEKGTEANRAMFYDPENPSIIRGGGEA